MSFLMHFLLILLLTYVSNGEEEFNATVAVDGSGNYTTINEAVANAPINSNSIYKIHIKEGVYDEIVQIPANKKNIMLIGDGADKTKITGNRSHAGGFRTLDTATVAVRGDGFVAKHLTIENSAKPSDGMAAAFMNKANHSAAYNCVFLGYQDTFHAREGFQFYRDCNIHGTVDFVFGAAKAVFQNSNFFARLPNHTITFTAQSKNSINQNSGYVFQNCSFTVAPEFSQRKEQVKALLGRAWGNYSTVIVMESWLDSIIYPRGWAQWDKPVVDLITYVEFRNRGPGSNTSGRVSWSKVLGDVASARQFTVVEFIGGDNWIPTTEAPYYGGFATNSSEFSLA
ncbi:Pectinesterase, catalytic [Corchorus capsularis]|uniref:Pectinesterase n=1 Tax=Corchorus capsularis TaxID=210143 RepID=A0A1R3IZE7_COCAP|nr:Pectinesterase, catalytic [Corchorus capsularis]